MSAVTDTPLEPDEADNEFEHLLDDAIGTTSGRTSKFDIADVMKAAKMVDESQVVKRIVSWRQEDRAGNHPGGRPPVVDDRVIFVVLLLLAREHAPLFSREMGNLLHQRLTTEARTFLGLPDTLPGSPGRRRAAGNHAARRLQTRRWSNAAWHAFHSLTATMDPFPDTQHYKLINRAERDRVLARRDAVLVEQRRVRLNWFSNAFLEMTFQLQPRDVRRRVTRRVTIGIDQTPIAAASSRGHAPIDPKTGLERTVHPKTGKKYADTLAIEQDAAWYAKSSEKRGGSGPDSKTGTDYIWGWAANVAVLVPTRRLDESEFPNIAFGFTMSMPGLDVARETVDVLQSIVDRGHTPGAVVADRFYFANLDPKTLHEPVKKMGWDVITDYKTTGLGIHGGKAGALQVEGRHYCAGTPEDLLNASVHAAAHKIDEGTYRKRLQERTAFELRPKEKPDARGHTPMMCPAVGPNPTLECPLRDLHNKAPKRERTEVLTKNLPEAPDLICTQGSVDFGPNDGIRDAQLFRYQSMEWSDGYRIGRNTDESYHAYVKDTGHEALDISSRRRIRGFAAQQVLATMLLVSANIRKIIKFLTNREESIIQRAGATLKGMGPVRKTTRRRDREGHSNYKANWPIRLLPGSPDGAELAVPLQI